MMLLKTAIDTRKIPMPRDRKVLWKEVCTIGEAARECLVEMSRSKCKFHILAIDLETDKHHYIEMWRVQAKNVLRACDNNLSKLMTFLEFRYGKLLIKDYELLLQHQLYRDSVEPKPVSISPKSKMEKAGLRKSSPRRASQIGPKPASMTANRSITNSLLNQVSKRTSFYPSNPIKEVMLKTKGKRQYTALAEIKKLVDQ